MNEILKNHPNDYVLVYSDCQFVKGVKNAVLLDLTNQEIYKIPSTYAEIASMFRNKTIKEIHHETTPENWENICSFISFLLDEKLAGFVSNISVFPEMELDWHEPNQIKTALIDYRGGVSDYDLKNTLEQLNELDCDHMEIRTYSPFSFSFLEKILEWLDPLFFKSIEIVAKDIDTLNEELLKEMMQKHHIINKVTLTHSKKNEILTIKRTYTSIVHIVRTKQMINGNAHCGIINPQSLFSPNIKQFSENHNYNSCLNRKLGIDENGEIKNCPSMATSFGNIKTVKLKTVVEKQDFRDKWSITKNQIDTCKSCEYRYLCTDCRAYVQDPENTLSKPLKCGYTPETGIWTDWMKADISQKGITYYSLDELVGSESYTT